MSVRQDTVSGVKWSAIEKIALQGIQFIIGIILARLLTPSDYGVLGMIAIFIAIANTFIDSGFSNALIRKKIEHKPIVLPYSISIYVQVYYVILYYFARHHI